MGKRQCPRHEPSQADLQRTTRMVRYKITCCSSALHPAVDVSPKHHDLNGCDNTMNPQETQQFWPQVVQRSALVHQRDSDSPYLTGQIQRNAWSGGLDLHQRQQVVLL